jgi:hypothetical protein
VNGMEKRYFYKKTEEVGSQGNTLYNVVVEYMEYNRIEVFTLVRKFNQSKQISERIEQRAISPLKEKQMKTIIILYTSLIPLQMIYEMYQSFGKTAILLLTLLLGGK